MTEFSMRDANIERVGDFRALREAYSSSVARTPIDYGRGIWIHGAGGFGRMLAGLLRARDVPLLGFIDRRGSELKSTDGMPVLEPEALSDADVAGACHLHALMNDTTPSRDIADWAAHRGFLKRLFPTDLYRIPGFDLQHYWLAPPIETTPHLDALEAVHDALSDAESRTVLRQLLAYRAHADPRLHPPVDRAGMYQPNVLALRGRPITFVDGGAYTGDSGQALLDGGATIDEWIAFEPDECNFARLRETAARNRARLPTFTLHRLGLSDTNGRVAFVEGDGAASRIAEHPNDRACAIEVARLDDIVSRKNNLYIKLDVEGSEQAALAGMPHLLATNPMLAISVYHKPADLWEIPLALMQRFPSARFHLRQHGYHAFDTVFYVGPT